MNFALNYAIPVYRRSAFWEGDTPVFGAILMQSPLGSAIKGNF